MSNPIVYEIHFKRKFETCDSVLIRHVWNFEKGNAVSETIKENCVSPCSKPYTRLNFTLINIAREKMDRKKKFLGYI